jgi:hypothetical protein
MNAEKGQGLLEFALLLALLVYVLYTIVRYLVLVN